MANPAPNFSEEFFSTRGKMKKRRDKIMAIEVEAPVPKRKTKGNPFRNTKSGARDDLQGLVVRSSWEANIIRVLKLHSIKFQFEPIVFEFPTLPSGRRSSYLPDIYLPKTDEFIEVKGYLDGSGRQKLRKFKKHFPTEFAKLTAVISKHNKANQVFFQKLGVSRILYYEHIRELYAHKVNWEG